MLEQLAPRERQIVEILYAGGETTAAAIRRSLPVLLSDQAVRTMLKRLEAKGLVARRLGPGGLLFSAQVPADRAQQSAVDQLVEIFFGGSRYGAMTALLGSSEALGDREIGELQRLLDKAREEKGQ